MSKHRYTDGPVEYYFERRRYGSGPSTRFYCWLMYRVEPSTDWHTYGDPWPKVTPSKAEVSKALADIKQKHESLRNQRVCSIGSTTK
jgi:hypothetical protein